MKFTILIFIGIALLISCRESLPEYEDLSKEKFLLVDQDSNSVSFPTDLNSSVFVIGYIFTNCPDICPLTTNNMRMIQESLQKENIANVHFVSISFDSETDNPETLRKYIEIRNLDLNNWTFLTGDKEEINRLMKFVGVVAVPTDTTKLQDREVVFFTHTDRISLMDENFKIRQNYSGSKTNLEQIVDDIKYLAD